MNHWKISLFALALATLISMPAHAEGKDTHAPVAAKPADQDKGGPDFIDEGQLEKIEKMGTEERRAFLEKRHERFKGMSDEQIKEYREKRKAWFHSLPPEQQEKMKARIQEMREKNREDMQSRLQNMTPEQREELKKKIHARMQERFENMSPEEKEKFMARRKEYMEHRRIGGDGDAHEGGSGKWMERRGEGGHGHADGAKPASGPQTSK